MKDVYSTSEIASIIGVHPNTIRFYEDMNLITKPLRKDNGYRIFTKLQLLQCQLVREDLKAEVLQNGLRKKALEILFQTANLDFKKAKQLLSEYQEMIKKEIDNTINVVCFVQDILGNKNEGIDQNLSRKETALLLDVTTETLRTWERSGLIQIDRYYNGYRVYSAKNIKQLKIIKALRLANYSLTSILRLMHAIENKCADDPLTVLNTTNDKEELVSVCDKLLVSLQNTYKDTVKMDDILVKIEDLEK